MSEVEEERGEAALLAAPEGQEHEAEVVAALAVPEGQEREPEDAAAQASEGEQYDSDLEYVAELVSDDEEYDSDLEDAAALEPQGSPNKSAVSAGTVAARWITERGQWVVLACIPRVAHRAGVSLPRRIHNLLDISVRAAPRASLLTVRRLFAPHRKALDNYPYIASANRRCLLLCASWGKGPKSPTLDGFTREQLTLDHHANKAYFLFKLTTTRIMVSVFPKPTNSILNPGNACLVDDGDGDYFFELQPIVDTASAHLLRYSSKLCHQWSVRIHNYPPLHRPWGAHGTLYHHRKIWWVDLSYGLIYGDAPAVVQGTEELSFVALPDRCALRAGAPDIDRRRCVGVSAGALRYVQIHKLCDFHGKLEPVVSLWTLIDEATGEWRRDYRTPFQCIWDDVGYKSTKLRPEVPAVALIHPNHADVVYFFQQSRIIGVDVRVGRVVEWQYFAMLHPPVPYQSSRFVRPWLVAPELLAVWTASPKSQTAVPSTSKSDKGSPTGSKPSNTHQGNPSRRRKRSP